MVPIMRMDKIVSKFVATDNKPIGVTFPTVVEVLQKMKGMEVSKVEIQCSSCIECYGSTRRIMVYDEEYDSKVRKAIKGNNQKQQETYRLLPIARGGRKLPCTAFQEPQQNIRRRQHGQTEILRSSIAWNRRKF